MGLTSNDLMLAAVLSLILTWSISKLLNFWNKINNTHEVEVGFRNADIAEALKKCYLMFPTESILFQGSEFKRGMAVRVTTSQHKVIEGKIVGANSENIICIVTKTYIVAHELDHIENMTSIEDGIY